MFSGVVVDCFGVVGYIESVAVERGVPSMRVGPFLCRLVCLFVSINSLMGGYFFESYWVLSVPYSL